MALEAGKTSKSLRSHGEACREQDSYGAVLCCSLFLCNPESSPGELGVLLPLLRFF